MTGGGGGGTANVNGKMLQFVRGPKGNPKLLIGGYAYFKNNCKQDRTYWLCARNRYHKCKARVITNDRNKLVVLKNQLHNHGAEYVDRMRHDEGTEVYEIVDDV